VVTGAPPERPDSHIYFLNHRSFFFFEKTEFIHITSNIIKTTLKFLNLTTTVIKASGRHIVVAAPLPKSP
jgi:hypothetical protein